MSDPLPQQQQQQQQQQQHHLHLHHQHLETTSDSASIGVHVAAMNQSFGQLTTTPVKKKFEFAVPTARPKQQGLNGGVRHPVRTSTKPPTTHARAATVSSFGSPHRSYYTPQQSRLVKPEQGAFMSTGLLSKKSRPRPEPGTAGKPHVPDTPCKRSHSSLISFSAPAGPVNNGLFISSGLPDTPTRPTSSAHRSTGKKQKSHNNESPTQGKRNTRTGQPTSPSHPSTRQPLQHLETPISNRHLPSESNIHDLSSRQNIQSPLARTPITPGETEEGRKEDAPSLWAETPVRVGRGGLVGAVSYQPSFGEPSPLGNNSPTKGGNLFFMKHASSDETSKTSPFVRGPSNLGLPGSTSSGETSSTDDALSAPGASSFSEAKRLDFAYRQSGTPSSERVGLPRMSLTDDSDDSSVEEAWGTIRRNSQRNLAAVAEREADSDVDQDETANVVESLAVKDRNHITDLASTPFKPKSSPVTLFSNPHNHISLPPNASPPNQLPTSAAFTTYYPHFLTKPYLDDLREGKAPPLNPPDSKTALYPPPTANYYKDHFENEFIVLGRLGSGSFAEAYRVQDRKTGEAYAIKKTKYPFAGTKDRLRRLEEVDILWRVVHHNHCVCIVSAWEQMGYLYIQTDVCEYGSLYSFLDDVCREQRIDEYRIWRILTELLLGVGYLHSLNILHLDLKPENVFITAGGRLKIGDFGLATMWPAALDVEREGDRQYMAPEVLSGSYDKPADVYSLGLIALEIAANVILPENGPAWQKLRTGDLSDCDLPPDTISQSLVDLIRSMVDPAPHLRPTVEAIMEHPLVATLVREYQSKGSEEVEGALSAGQGLGLWPYAFNGATFPVQSPPLGGIAEV